MTNNISDELKKDFEDMLSKGFNLRAYLKFYRQNSADIQPQFFADMVDMTQKLISAIEYLEKKINDLEGK